MGTACREPNASAAPLQKSNSQYLDSTDHIRKCSHDLGEFIHAALLTSSYWHLANKFWVAVVNTGIIVGSVVVISLTLGTLGGYALALPAMRHPVFLVVVIAGQKVYCCDVVLIDSALQHKR